MPHRSEQTESDSQAESRNWAAHYEHIGAVLMNPLAPKARKQGAGLQLAIEVLNDLEHYMRVPSPKLPPQLADMTEREIVDKLTSMKGKVRKDGSSNASQADKDLVMLFAVWREAVFTVESKNAGRVEVLYFAARVFESVSAEYPAHVADLDVLDTFMRTEWSLSARPALGWFDAARAGARAACDLRACPSYFRTPSDMAEIPRGRGRGGEPTRVQASFGALGVEP
jgi:hypothetical protein